MILRMLAVMVLLAGGIGCTDAVSHPSYSQLQEENEQLEGQLSAAHDGIAQAKSDLDDLRTGINELQGQSCTEDQADTLDSQADDVESSLDQAEEESN